MNTAVVTFELDEAYLHLSELIAELKSGKITKDDSMVVSIQLAHIMDHICRAWNCKDQTPEEQAALSQEEFERLSNLVPNFMGEKILGPYTVC